MKIQDILQPHLIFQSSKVGSFSKNWIFLLETHRGKHQRISCCRCRKEMISCFFIYIYNCEEFVYLLFMAKLYLNLEERFNVKNACSYWGNKELPLFSYSEISFIIAITFCNRSAQDYNFSFPITVWKIKNKCAMKNQFH